MKESEWKNRFTVDFLLQFSSQEIYLLEEAKNDRYLLDTYRYYYRPINFYHSSQRLLHIFLITLSLILVLEKWGSHLLAFIWALGLHLLLTTIG